MKWDACSMSFVYATSNETPSFMEPSSVYALLCWIIAHVGPIVSNSDNAN